MFLMHFMRMVAQWRRFNGLLAHLNQMNDRELSELGISRSDVIRFAMEHSER
jgi:uncharacterized protein YjiS (DUF1127 family)